MGLESRRFGEVGRIPSPPNLNYFLPFPAVGIAPDHLRTAAAYPSPLSIPHDIQSVYEQQS